MVDTTEQVTEQESNVDGQHTVTREVTHASQEERISRGVRVVWFLIGIIVTFLLVRFILALLGANLENPFASLIYSVTEPLVYSFRGLLQVSQFRAGVSRFELETLLAALVYVLIGWGIAAAIQLFSKKPIS